MLNEIRKTIANFIAPTQNAMSLPDQFLRYGSRKTSFPDWSEVRMSDKDHYSGYLYAAIKKRANKVSRLATERVTTESSVDGLVHPYLEIIDSSPTFSNYFFWYSISTFLDLEGWFPLMAVRNFNGTRMGNIKEFKLLNPYYVKPVYKSGTFELGGYIEMRDGKQREIPKELIIPIYELNPFDERVPFALTDAAVNPNFTLKTASDYTRQSLKNNVNAPGIFTTGVVLSPEKFRNFTERIKNHDKGEPLFGNGAGAIDYKDTSIDLTKSALKDINDQNVQELISVAGLSKSMLGIEQSGVTRETSKIQKDELIESEILPRVQMILDALNQDYKNNAPEIGKTDAVMVVDNPLKVDHEADAKHTEVLTKRAELYNSLISQGYDYKKVALYVKGELDIEELGEPVKPEPVVEPVVDDKPDDGDNSDNNNSITHTHNDTCGCDIQINSGSNAQMSQQEGALKNAIINIEEQLVAHAIRRVSKTNNQFEETTELITKTEQKDATAELVGALMAFYGLMISLEGQRTMRSRMSEFAMMGIFKVDSETKKYIKETAEKVAESHIQTIVNDIWQTARDAANEGKGRNEIINLLKQNYSDVITQTRAKTIARTETNRAFTQAQYQADQQFIKQNKLQGRVYKQWRTKSSNPCEFCKQMESEGLIPFEQSFRDLGGSVTAGDKTLSITFETVKAGNLHPNCACAYELVVMPEQTNAIVGDIEKLDTILNELGAKL